ncbi:MAG: M23 family metallopeptidase [Deltaproteobacteria bacterium]|nr:M23 family metallopeptidase [Deltaproteobacteria bacterium]
MGKKILYLPVVIFLAGVFFVYHITSKTSPDNARQTSVETPGPKVISSNIEPGETLSAVFQKHGLNMDELFAMKQAAAAVHRLRQVHPGKPYRFILDDNDSVRSFTYAINDNTTLKIERGETGFSAKKCEVPYESRILTVGGAIEDNLMSAVGSDRDDVLLALQISDILAWDIDFNTDLRAGDTFRVIVEGLYLEDEFKKYGKILAVEFVNDSGKHAAYLYETDGRRDYYNAAGKSVRKAFLKAPLSFRRISSSYSKSRLHPILKIYRPHHGIDYAAPAGTPVNATADGRIRFSGHKGAYGKLVIIAHHNGLTTYYGHLSRIVKGMRTGKKVQQGDLIGYVGKTGLATGPHLHYEMRQNNRPVNPKRFRIDAGKSVPEGLIAQFKEATALFDRTFATAVFYETKNVEGKKNARAFAVRTDDLSGVN